VFVSTGGGQRFACQTSADCQLQQACCSGFCQGGSCVSPSSSTSGATSSTSGGSTSGGQSPCLSFESPIAYDAGPLPNLVATGDFNRDGLTDLVVSSQAGVMLFTQRSGGLTSRLLAPGGAAMMVTGDVNGDGWLDVIASNDAGVLLLLNLTDGGFQAVQRSTPFSDVLAVGNFTLDGGLDLVVGNGCLTAPTTPCSNSVVILSNQQLLGGGTAPPIATLDAGNGLQWATVADLNGDGLPDLVLTLFWSDLISVFLNQGGGHFADPVFYVAGHCGEPIPLHPWTMVAGDFDGDHSIDLAVSDNSCPGVFVLLNDGGGGFPASGQSVYVAGQQPRQVVAAALSGVSGLDLAVADYLGNAAVVLPHGGSGLFNTAVSFPAGPRPVSLAAGDFNGDGKPDLAVVNQVTSSLEILLNNCP
jgi:hypothetical protein